MTHGMITFYRLFFTKNSTFQQNFDIDEKQDFFEKSMFSRLNRWYSYLCSEELDLRGFLFIQRQRLHEKICQKVLNLKFWTTLSTVQF